MPFFSEQKTDVQTEYQLKHNSYRALKVFCSFTKRCDFYHDDHAWEHVPVFRETLSGSHVSFQAPKILANLISCPRNAFRGSFHHSQDRLLPK